jgi:hypothetical protein
LFRKKWAKKEKGRKGAVSVPSITTAVLISPYSGRNLFSSAEVNVLSTLSNLG